MVGAKSGEWAHYKPELPGTEINYLQEQQSLRKQSNYYTKEWI